MSARANGNGIAHVQAAFLEALPVIAAYVHRSFRSLSHWPRKEAIQDAYGLAWQSFLRLHRLGKVVSPWQIAHYAVLEVRRGRSILGSDGSRCTVRKVDVYAACRPQAATCENGKGDQLELVADPKASLLDDEVAFSLDLEEWRSTLPCLDRWIVTLLANGYTAAETAAEAGVTERSINRHRAAYRKSWEAFLARPKGAENLPTP